MRRQGYVTGITVQSTKDEAHLHVLTVLRDMLNEG